MTRRLFFVPGPRRRYHGGMDARTTARRVALIGLMGAGKTRVGRALAERLGWPFHDADRQVEEAAGTTVASLFADRGEAEFRRLEAETLQALAAAAPPLVASLGGGVVERAQNRRVLERDFTVVWIRVDPREAARRLAGASDRPLLAGGDPVRVLTDLAARRAPLYQRLADATVTTGVASTPEGVAGEILRVLAGVR